MPMDNSVDLKKRIHRLEAEMEELTARVAGLEIELAKRPLQDRTPKTKEDDFWPVRDSWTPNNATMYKPRKD